jgi:hypothetical protein
VLAVVVEDITEVVALVVDAVTGMEAVVGGEISVVVKAVVEDITELVAVVV